MKPKTIPELRAALQRFVDGHFHNAGKERPRISIPANTERDDDLVLSDAIDELGALRRSLPDDLRADGWAVAVHNDYRQAGEPHTFWLLTRGDRCVKGEGKSDAEALGAIRAALRAAEKAPEAREPAPPAERVAHIATKQDAGQDVGICPICSTAIAIGSTVAGYGSDDGNRFAHIECYRAKHSATERAPTATPLVNSDATGLHLSPLARDGLNLPPAAFEPETVAPVTDEEAARIGAECRAWHASAKSAPSAADGLTAEEWGVWNLTYGRWVGRESWHATREAAQRECDAWNRANGCEYEPRVRAAAEKAGWR